MVNMKDKKCTIYFFSNDNDINIGKSLTVKLLKQKIFFASFLEDIKTFSMYLFMYLQSNEQNHTSITIYISAHNIKDQKMNSNILDRQPNQKVPLNAFYLLFPNKLMYMVTIDGSQSLIASHTIIRKTCPDHSEE